MKNRNLDHKDHWQTPPYFYNTLNERFNFDFDPCPLNHDLSLWDGLKIEWGYRNFVNPGYSLETKKAFIFKAFEQWEKYNKLSVMLLPVSTSTLIFHNVLKVFCQIEFVYKRINFIGQNQYGQFVNYHLIQDIDVTETIEFIDDKGVIKQILKYVKQSGQHDSMLCIFNSKK
jgi:hypothetical protein